MPSKALAYRPSGALNNRRKGQTMNGKPHVHEFKIEKRYRLIDEGPLMLRYGDQEMFLPKGFMGRRPSANAIEKAKRRIVQMHDRQSQEAQGWADLGGTFPPPAFDVERWPSDQKA